MRVFKFLSAGLMLATTSSALPQLVTSLTNDTEVKQWITTAQFDAVSEAMNDLTGRAAVFNKRSSADPKNPWGKYGKPPASSFDMESKVTYDCDVRYSIFWNSFHASGANFDMSMVGQKGELLLEYLKEQCGLDHSRVWGWDFKTYGKVHHHMHSAFDWHAKGRIAMGRSGCVERALMMVGAVNWAYGDHMTDGKWWSGVCH